MKSITNMKEIETYINQNGEIVIDKNNRSNVILMNMEEYRNNILDKETMRKLLKSEEDIGKGRTRKASEVINELRVKYGF